MSRRSRERRVYVFSPGVSEAIGVEVFLAGRAGFLAGGANRGFVTGFFGRTAGACAWDGNNAAGTNSTNRMEITGMRMQADFAAARFMLMAQNRGGIGIIAEDFGVSATQNFHHPVIKIIHRMGENRLETAIVFFMSLFNVVTQS